MSQQFPNEAQDAAITNALVVAPVISDITDQQVQVLQHANGNDIFQTQGLHAPQGYISLYGKLFFCFSHSITYIIISKTHLYLSIEYLLALRVFILCFYLFSVKFTFSFHHTT